MRTFVKIFVDKHKLDEMLRLRSTGWTYKSLALIYGVDHSSIYKWCKIKRIHKPRENISLHIPSLIGLLGLGERPVKTYKDYLETDRRRKLHSILRQYPN